MKIDLEFAQLHVPLFTGGDKKGVNLGSKLDPKQRTGLSLSYSREDQELLVTFKDEHGIHLRIVPITNVVSMAPRMAPKVEEAKPSTEKQVFERPTAQVDTPTSHVFAGEGKGKTGKG